MKTLAVLLFIAGVAALAIHLVQRTTVADGRVMEADLLAQLREHGVTGMSCDREIPIGKQGAVFTCVATLESGATQTVEYRMDRAGALTAALKAETAPGEPAPPGRRDAERIPASGDPWAH